MPAGSTATFLRSGVRHGLVVGALAAGLVAGCAEKSEAVWSPGGRCELRASHDEAFGQVETLALWLHRKGEAPREIWREASDVPSRPVAWRSSADVDVETLVDGRLARRRLHAPACAPEADIAPRGDLRRQPAAGPGGAGVEAPPPIRPVVRPQTPPPSP